MASFVAGPCPMGTTGVAGPSPLRWLIVHLILDALCTYLGADVPGRVVDAGRVVWRGRSVSVQQGAH